MTLALASCLLASGAPAQTRPDANVFFGFEFVLVPIAIKWFCGGDSDRDLSALSALITAFPEAAKHADMQDSVDLVLKMSKLETGLTELGLPEMVGYELSAQQVEELCTAALQLNLVWLTPENLKSAGYPHNDPEQKASWEAFFAVLEGFQQAEPP